MSTQLAPFTAAQARAWLPGPARRVDAACPGCGDRDSLVYSCADAYVACLGCGWQRRLAGRTHARHVDSAAGRAALAASLPGLWPDLLRDLARLPADPLPPVAALLWRQTGPDTWAGPSRSTPDTTWTITRTAHRIKCNCPNLRGLCWHRHRAAELGCTDDTAFADLWG